MGLNRKRSSALKRRSSDIVGGCVCGTIFDIMTLIVSLEPRMRLIQGL